MLILTNGTIVTGDGDTVTHGGTVVVDGDRIVDVRAGSLAGGPGDQVIDLAGRLLVPGAINSHSHGVTTAPLYASAAPPLAFEQVLENLDRQLRGGTTTLQSVDGFNLPEEIEQSRRAHPMNIGAGTTHYPLAFEAARQADGSGLTPAHERMTVEQMLSWGATGVLEVGAGHTLAGGGQDYLYIPNAIEAETGVRLVPTQAAALKYAVLGRRVQVDAYDRERVEQTLREIGLEGKITPERARDVIHSTVLPSFAKALEGIREAARIAVAHNVPTMMHNSAPSEEAMYDAADIAGPLLICGHTNHTTFNAEESIASARNLKAKGAIIEISVLDAFGAKRSVQTPENMYGLLERNLVDIAATDYAGGYWDNLYFGMGHAVEDGVVSLPRAVAMCTREVTRAFPRLAPERGEIAPGMIADLAVCRGRLDRVDLVFISGKLVCEDGEVRRDGTSEPSEA